MRWAHRTRQWSHAWQACNWRWPEIASACDVPSRSRRQQPQSRTGEICHPPGCRRKTTQGHRHCSRTKAGHYRKRSRQIRTNLACSGSVRNTVASTAFSINPILRVEKVTRHGLFTRRNASSAISRHTHPAGTIPAKEGFQGHPNNPGQQPNARVRIAQSDPQRHQAGGWPAQCPVLRCRDKAKVRKRFRTTLQSSAGDDPFGMDQQGFATTRDGDGLTNAVEQAFAYNLFKSFDLQTYRRLRSPNCLRRHCKVTVGSDCNKRSKNVYFEITLHILASAALITISKKARFPHLGMGRIMVVEVLL